MIFFNGKELVNSNTQIGGRNYLLNSVDFTHKWEFYGASSISDKTYLGGKIINLANDGDNVHNVQQIADNICDGVSQMTWSCFARADNEGDELHTELWGSKSSYNQPLIPTWQRYIFTGFLDEKDHHLYFWGNSKNKGSIQIALPKLEIGPIATDWTPAPEDFLNERN